MLFALTDWGQSNDAVAKTPDGKQTELDLFARGMLAAVFHRMSSAVARARGAVARGLKSRHPDCLRRGFTESQSEEL